MKIIGVTGRSGCGKSSVMALLKEAGFSFVDADEIARIVLEPGSSCLAALQNAFGSDILDGNGKVRRQLVAQRAFATKAGTQMLTSITFPEIERRVLLAAQEARKQGCTFFFVDGAVIIGTPFEKKCDAIVLVTASYEKSMQRICCRDKISQEAACQRLAAQPTEETLRAGADYVLENDGSVEELRGAVKRLLRWLQEENHDTTESDTQKRS